MAAMTLIPIGSDPANFDGTYISFRMAGQSPSGKTAIWLVTAKGGDWLGEVRWFSRWRKYSFFPYPSTVFETTCLSELAEFLKDRTREQRTGI